MADTSNEESMSVSTTSTASDTGLEMYRITDNPIGDRKGDQIGCRFAFHIQ